MKIKISKDQWEGIGKKAGWMKTAQTNPIVQFGPWKCEIIKERYNNGRIALQLVGAENNENTMKGEPIATATVNVPEMDLEPNEVIIKDYSENEGMLDTLVKSKIVKDTGKRVEGGFVTMPICKLLI